MTWDEDVEPVRVENARLSTITDNLGRDLAMRPAQNIRSSRIGFSEQRNRVKEVVIETKVPDDDARSIRNIAGTIDVVYGTTAETVVIDDLHALIGKTQTGNDLLDERRFRVKSFSDTGRIVFDIDGGRQAVSEFEVYDVHGSPIRRRSLMTSANRLTYDFETDAEQMAEFHIQIVTAEHTVTAPFSLDELTLPGARFGK